MFRKHTCDDCGKPCGKESNYCASCNALPTSVPFGRLAIHPASGPPAPRPNPTKPYQPADNVTDVIDKMYATIETLQERVTKLELLTKTPCANCEGYAATGDYLCQTCRTQ